jgi:hypothetical protein
MKKMKNLNYKTLILSGNLVKYIILTDNFWLNEHNFVK